MPSQKTVLITGASRGIGRTLCRHFVAAGWRVIATARDTAPLASLGAHVTLPLDVASDASVAGLGAALGQSEAVDVLINNAGVFVAGDLGALAADSLSAQFATNAFGPILTAQALLPNLKLAAKNNGSAWVVNISSVMGSIGENPNGKYYGYRGSKAALNAMSKSLAIDLKSESIGVLLFHPGYVKTDMAPAGTISQEESVAGMTKIIQEALEDSTLSKSGEFYAYDGRKISW